MTEPTDEDPTGVAGVRRRLADQSLALEWLAALPGTNTRQDAITSLLGLVQDLCAPAAVGFVPRDPQRAAESIVRPDHPPVRDHLMTLAQALAPGEAWLMTDAGLVMAIGGGEAEVGLLVLDQVAFPDHLPEYRRLLQAVTPAVAAALRSLFERTSSAAEPAAVGAAIGAAGPAESATYVPDVMPDSPIPTGLIDLGLPDGTGAPTLLQANRALITFLGGRPADSGTTVPDLPELPFQNLLGAAEGAPVEHCFALPSGSLRWGLISLTRPIDTGADTRLRLLQIQDITPRRQAQAELAHKAQHDPVTNLPNRDLLLEILAERLALDRSAGHRTALVLLDLDDFKSVNQSLGHHGGNHYLRGVADLLMSLLRPGDAAAHLGSDEFAVVFAAVDDPTTAVSLTDQVRAELAAGVRVADSTVSAAASLGITVSRRGTAPAKMLAQAENAMFTAKRQGGNTWHLDAHQSVRGADRVVTIEADLRTAIAEDQFELRYQPVFPLQPGAALVEVEALLRWQHPVLGRMMPDEFIEIAERRNLMPALGEWVLRAACTQAARWQSEFGADAPQIAVNVSSKQLGNSNLINIVSGCLAAAGLDVDGIQLEITESQIINASSPAAAELDALAASGIRIAVDDFGTGHAGFQYLRRLPIGVLKIDKSFIDGICTDATDLAFLKGIIALGKSLDLTLIAEGVETLEQLHLLRALGCDQGQGWLWRPALRPEDVAALIGVPEDQVRSA